MSFNPSFLIALVGLVYRRSPAEYGGRADWEVWPIRKSSSSGYGNGAAELEAPGGKGKVGLDEEGAGYWNRPEA